MNTVDREQIRRFLELQYGTDKGTVWIGAGTKQNHAEVPFLWPEQVEEIVEYVATTNEAGHEVWYAAHLSYSKAPKPEGQGRAVKMSVKRRRLHFDIDRALTAEDTAKLTELQAWLVYSGTPGHVHAYIELNRSVDVATYHKFEDWLVTYFGSDTAVCRDNGLLRIPGTVNCKPGAGSVTWDGAVSEYRWVPEELAAHIGLDLSVVPQAAAQVANDAEPIAPVTPQRIPESVRDALNASSADRSSKTAKIVNACRASGLSLKETLHCLQLDAGQAERYQQKGSAFMYKEVRKLYGTADDYNPQLKDKAADEILGIPGKAMENQGDAFTDSGTSPPALTTAQWDEIDLSYMFADDYRPLETTLLIRDDEIGLLYAGKSHSFQGISESGKSWIALWAVVEQIRLGHRVMYIDYEMGPAQTLDNLRAFGITAAELQLFSYRQWETSPPVEYLKSLTGYTLIVIDATTACLSTMGLSGSDNDDIAKWFTRFVDPLKFTGAAVSIIDHLTKAAEDAGTYAIGAQSKRALADVSFAVKMTQQMARGRHGELELRVVKDRPGWIRQHCPEQTKTPVAARFQMVSDEAGNLTVKVEAPTLQQKVDAVQSMVETFALLGMPTDYGRTRAERFLTEHNVNGVRTETLTDALRNYKARAALVPE